MNRLRLSIAAMVAWGALALEAPRIHAVTPVATSSPKLIKLPIAFDKTMESTPVVFDSRPLLVLNYRDDSKNHTDRYTKSMHLYVRDLRTGRQISRFAEGHSFASALVDGSRLHVFCSQGTNNDWFQSIYRFSSTDLKTWELSPKNPILEASAGEGINNSDVDLFEFEGNTYLFYATGDQATWGAVRVAMFPGKMEPFFESYFPAGVATTRLSAKTHTNGRNDSGVLRDE